MMKNKDMMKDIIKDIMEKHKSLENPDFFFTHKPFQNKPFHQIIKQIEGEGFQVREYTDMNDEVCFTYHLTKQEGFWIVQISIVGPYAVLFRFSEDRTRVVKLVHNNDQNLSTSEKRLLEILNYHNIHTLDCDILTQPVRLKLFNVDIDKVRIYHALFSDLDGMPEPCES